MKKLFFILTALVLVSFSSLFGQKTIMDPNAELRTRESFNSINISSAFDIFLSQGNEHAVVVSAASTAVRDLIEAKVQNGTLIVKLKNTGKSWRGDQKLRVYISTPDLNKIDVSGACNLIIEESFKTIDLEVKMSGASDFRGTLQVENLRLSSSGSSDYMVGGTARNLKVDLSGSSDLKGFELVSDYCDVNCSGSSDVQITANKELKVTVSGASGVQYKGDAVVKELKTSGSASLKKKQ